MFRLQLASNSPWNAPSNVPAHFGQTRLIYALSIVRTSATGNRSMFVRIIRAMLRPPRRRLPPKVIPNHRRRRPTKGDGSPSAAKPRPFDPTSAKTQTEKVVVSGSADIVDGDTITINGIQIRLFGVDAPESHHPFGNIATSALRDLCKGKKVVAEVLEKDCHGRTVAKCRLEDGRDLSEEMVKLGLAIDWPKFSGGVYQKFETDDARRKLWLADARQKGRMYLWHRYDLESARPTRAKKAASKNRDPVAKRKSPPAPLCPTCGAKMFKRTNRRTKTAFWGCSGFPKCRGSLNVG